MINNLFDDYIDDNDLTSKSEFLEYKAQVIINSDEIKSSSDNVDFDVIKNKMYFKHNAR